MEKYEINDKTLAIIPINKEKSKVIEIKNTYIVKMTPIQIIDHSCKYFGSSYLGRHEGTKEIIGTNYKTPVIIEETQNIIFFPTRSSRVIDCCWISLEQIYKCDEYHDISKVIFKNGYELIVNVSYGSLKNQIQRSTMLDSIVRKRRKIG